MPHRDESQTVGYWRDFLDGSDPTVLGSRKHFWEWVAKRLVQRGVAIDRVIAIQVKMPDTDWLPLPYAC